MAREKPPTTADKLAFMLSVVAPELDIEAELDEVAVKGNGDLVWTAPEPPEPTESSEDDSDSDTADSDTEREEAAPEDLDDSEMTRRPPAGRSREQRNTRQEQSKPTTKPASSDPTNRDSPGYDYQADVDQWIAGDVPQSAT